MKIPRPRGASKLVTALFSAALLLGAGATAHAITYGPDCGSGNCFGSVYTLAITNTTVGATTTAYDFAYTVNTAGYIGAGSGLDAVAFKVAAENNIVSASLLSQVNTGGTFGSLAVGGLSAGGCSGASNGGFICVSSSNLGGVAAPNGTYTYTFATTITNGKLLAENDWSVKALYVDSGGKQRGLTSVTGGSVPVPGTLLLFGLGFALVIGWHYRSRGSRVQFSSTSQFEI